MKINDLMNELGINPEPEKEKPASRPERPARRRKQTAPKAEPKATAKRSQGRPEAGKIYSLSGIAQGKTWAESEVTGTAQTADATARSSEKPPSSSELPTRDGFEFKHGISRTGAPYAFWSGQGRATKNLTTEEKETFKDSQSEALAAVIDRAWRMRRASSNRLGFNAVGTLKDAYAQALSDELEDETETQTTQPQEPQAKTSDSSHKLEEKPATTVAPDPLETASKIIDATGELDSAYQAFRASRDLGDASRLQKAMTAFIQAGGK